MVDSINSGNFSLRSYLPVIRKDSNTHMHDLAVYMKEGLPFTQDLSLENSADSSLCFLLALLHLLSYFLFPHWLPSISLWTLFDSISSNVDEVLPIIQSTNNVFIFGDFNIHHKDCLTYFSRNDKPGEFYYIFSILNDLTHMVNFPTCKNHDKETNLYYEKQ